MKHPINFQCKSVLQRLAIMCTTVFFVSASYAQELVKVVVIPMAGDDLRTVYEIGKTGPAGGIVFHVTDGGLHGLEAAPNDHSTTVEWGCDGIDIGDIVNLPNKETIDPNTSAHNTQAIVDDANDCGTGGAADVASSYKGPNGITTGWYLPNKEELDLLYDAKVAGTVGGFVSATYWSSSEFGSFDAWVQAFGSGGQGGASKDFARRVRAVRAF